MTEAAIPFPIYRNRFIGVYPEARPSGNRQSDGAVLTHSPLPPTNLLPILINSFISFLKPAILKSCMNWPTSIRYFPIYRRPTIDGPENVGPCGRRTRKRDGTTWSRVLPFFFFRRLLAINHATDSLGYFWSAAHRSVPEIAGTWPTRYVRKTFVPCDSVLFFGAVTLFNYRLVVLKFQPLVLFVFWSVFAY